MIGALSHQLRKQLCFKIVGEKMNEGVITFEDGVSFGQVEDLANNWLARHKDAEIISRQSHIVPLMSSIGPIYRYAIVLFYRLK
jgi:hypothetical protein